MEEEFHRAEQKAAELESYLDDLASRPRTILYLCDADGGVVFDLAVVRKLLRMQHRVIFAVKDGFFFYAPTLDDVEEDPVLREEPKQDYIVRDAHLSKNQLLRHLREHRLLVISDGTRSGSTCTGLHQFFPCLEEAGSWPRAGVRPTCCWAPAASSPAISFATGMTARTCIWPASACARGKN